MVQTFNVCRAKLKQYHPVKQKLEPVQFQSLKNYSLRPKFGYYTQTMRLFYEPLYFSVSIFRVISSEISVIFLYVTETLTRMYSHISCRQRSLVLLVPFMKPLTRRDWSDSLTGAILCLFMILLKYSQLAVTQCDLTENRWTSLSCKKTAKA